MKRKLLRGVMAAVIVSAGLAVVPSAGAAQDGTDAVPMIFVHGFLGSGQQFEAQALRFTSNGYPAERIELFEHDSLAYPGSQDEVWDRLEEQIADLLAVTGAEQVNLLGHSQGTGLLQGYLNSDPARAADVAHYVNLDGGSGGTVPDEVDTLAVWGEGDPDREVLGATNVYFLDQAHTEVVNSPETFVEIHRFFTGEDPAVDEVVREPADEIVVSGRALLFPENAGATDATLDIHEVDPETGVRISDSPAATFELSGDGAWGPFDADGEAFYEFAITRETATHHVYLQRFVRSHPWVRILTSEPDGLVDSFWENGDDHSNLVVLRNKEWWGDQGESSDSLEVNGTEVLNEVTSPRTNRTIGVFVHDDGADGESNVEEPVSPFGIPFLTGIDLHLPAADPPDATIGVVATPRLGDGPESVCTPNWASSTDRISIQLANYHQLLNPDGSQAPGHPNPDCASAEGPVDTTPPGEESGVPTPPGPEDDVDVDDADDGSAPPAAPVPGDPSFTG